MPRSCVELIEGDQPLSFRQGPKQFLISAFFRVVKFPLDEAEIFLIATLVGIVPEHAPVIVDPVAAPLNGTPRATSTAGTIERRRVVAAFELNGRGNGGSLFGAVALLTEKVDGFLPRALLIGAPRGIRGSATCYSKKPPYPTRYTIVRIPAITQILLIFSFGEFQVFAASGSG